MNWSYRHIVKYCRFVKILDNAKNPKRTTEIWENDNVRYFIEFNLDKVVKIDMIRLRKS